MNALAFFQSFSQIIFVNDCSKVKMVNVRPATIVTPTLSHIYLGHVSYNIFSMVLDKVERANNLSWRNKFECSMRAHKFIEYANGAKPCHVP